MSLQGRTLNRRYTLGPQVGSGGMATVYQASDRVLRRTVAVKVLHFPYDSDPAFVAKFQQEARTAAGLNHPNIVAVFDTGSDDDLHYIVMEYVDGENLAALVEREGPLAPATAARLGWSVCQALEAAHARGLVHRDVKPGNVIVSQAGATKVTDFGIAKAVAATTTAGRTSGASVLGTASYMSPEQAQGRRVDERSDLYSLGCVLYELLTGKPPFVTETAIGVVWKHVSEDPEPLVERRPDAGAALAAVVDKALAKDPADRYQTAREMGDDLERVVVAPAAAGVPAPPAAPAPAAAATAPARRVRLGWPLLAALGLALAGALLAVLLRGVGSPDERGTSAAPSSLPAVTAPPPTTAPAAVVEAATSSSSTTTGASTTAPAPTTSASPTTSPTRSRPPSTQRSLPGALANLTEVLTGGVIDGTVTPRASSDLVHKAQDVVRAIQDGHADEAPKKLQELEARTEEFIAKGEIEPAAADRVRAAVTEFGDAVERVT